jgi:serine/threonine protein kinase
LVDEAFALWAEDHGTPTAEVKGARERTGPAQALFEVMVEEGLVSAEAAQNIVSGSVSNLDCSSCGASFELSRPLALALGSDVVCPVCERGELELEGEGEFDLEDELRGEDELEYRDDDELRGEDEFEDELAHELVDELVGEAASEAASEADSEAASEAASEEGGSVPSEGEAQREDEVAPEVDGDETKTLSVSDDGLPRKKGRYVGPYRLRRLLGAGGMGSVHLAEGPKGEAVALKLLGGAFKEAARQERFSREGAFLREAHHPNIVDVLDSGVDETSGRPYLALEVVPGRDLETILEENGVLAVDEVVGIVDQVSSALGYLHAKGILHRDLTAANVLTTPFGEIKLSDFGLALDVNDSVRLTLTGKVVGTPVAIDPAVLRGEEWCPASDLYALGVMAFRLLSGEDPFPGNNPQEVFEAQMHVMPPRVDVLRPGIPEFLVNLVEELLDKEATQRPTALDVRARLSDDLPNAATLIRLGKSGGSTSGWATTDGASDTRTPGTEGGVSSSGEVFAPQDRFFHFEIEGEIGRGGMGVVYRARHLKLKRRVALKVLLRGSMAKKEERRRFLREAESAGVLNHPNVVSILDAGEHEGRTYLCMDFVRGVSLVRRIRDDTPRETLLRMFLEICAGVHHAHSRGVIHRDLKPDNILVDERGRPRILDFGIAKRFDQPDDGDSTDGALTTEGDILGTLRYMPPEQAAGKVEDIDIRSDVFALGTILYELLCGNTPFKGTMAEVLHQIHFSQPTPPSKQDRSIPWELDSICLKALEKDRDDRYQSALGLRQDVQRFLDGMPIEAKRATPIYRLRKWAYRNQARAAAILTGFTLVTVLASGWAYSVISREQSYRASMLEAVTKGIDSYEGGQYRAAREAFVAARERIRGGELLLLPSHQGARVPINPGGERHTQQQQQHEWISADRLDRWAVWAQTQEERGEVERFLEEARLSFEAGRLDDASKSLQVAGRLAPSEERVGDMIRAVASEEVRIARKRLEAAPRESSGARRAALAAARRSYEKAQSLDPTSREAVEALFEVASELGQLAEIEREAAVREESRGQCKRYVLEASKALDADKLQEARRSFEQALAFDGSSESARDGLVEAQRRLDERQRRLKNADEAQRLEREQAELKAKVRSLLERASRALKAGKIADARTAYIQALAFDGRNREAQKGVVEVYRREEAAKRRAERRRDLERLEGALREGARALELGRRAFRQSKDPAEVRERYFAALEAVRKGLVLSPTHRPARQLLHRISAELSLILIEQGYPELADFVRRIGGVPKQTVAELPTDPYLVVIEASVVNLRATFNGAPVSFVPTKVFDPLRKQVQAETGERVRVRIEVRSRVQKKGLNTEVFIVGLYVSLEDRIKKTRKKVGELPFKGGPYRRIVQSDSRGRRIVRPFDQSRGLDPRPYVKQIEGMVSKALVPFRKPKKPSKKGSK